MIQFDVFILRHGFIIAAACDTATKVRCAPVDYRAANAAAVLAANKAAQCTCQSVSNWRHSLAVGAARTGALPGGGGASQRPFDLHAGRKSRCRRRVQKRACDNKARRRAMLLEFFITHAQMGFKFSALARRGSRAIGAGPAVVAGLKLITCGSSSSSSIFVFDTQSSCCDTALCFLSRFMPLTLRRRARPGKTDQPVDGDVEERHLWRFDTLVGGYGPRTGG